MMAATVLAKLLGLLRSVIFASLYSTGIEANAFTVASHIPLTLFDLLLSAAILGCFIPAYAGFFTGDGAKEAEGDRFACVFLNTILLLTALIAAVGIVAAEPIVSLMAPELDGETKALAAKLLRIMFPMIIFAGAAYTLVGVMQTRGRYLLPAMISAVSNAGVVVYLLFIAPRLGDGGIIGLGVAYLVSWAIQFLTLALPLGLSGFRFRLLVDFKNPALRDAMKKLPPIMAGSWLMPVTVYSGVFFSSFITEKVSVFDYANNIYVLATGILTYSLCNYIFPKLAKTAYDAGGYAALTAKSLRIALTVILPFAAAVFVLSGEGTSVIYLRREFDAESARLCAGVVKRMAFGMPFFAVTELLSRAFYAKKQTRPPMLAALCGIAVNVAASALLITLPDAGIEHIGIAYTLGQAASAVILAVSFIAHNRVAFGRGYAIELAATVTAGALSLCAMLAAYGFTGGNPYSDGIVKNLVCCVIVFAAGAAVYAAALTGFSAIRAAARKKASDQ